MARYLALWEGDNSRMPIDPKERASGFQAALGKIKEDMKKGLIKDWGSFVGVPNGFAIYEGSEVDVEKSVQQYAPFYTFKVYPLSSLAQTEELIKALSE